MSTPTPPVPPVAPPAPPNANPQQAVTDVRSAVTSDISAAKTAVVAAEAKARAQYDSLKPEVQAALHQELNNLEMKFNVVLGDIHTLFGAK